MVRRDCWRADLALAGVTFIWGSTFVVVKEALGSVSPLLFLAVRFSLAAVALAVAFRAQWSFGGRIRTSLGSGALAGLCLFAGYTFQTFGLKYTTAPKSAFLTGMTVVITPLLSAAVYRRNPGTSEWLGTAVATGGMGLMTLRGANLHLEKGDLLTLACAVAFALHIIVLGHYASRVSFGPVSVAQITVAAALASGSFWWAEDAFIRWTPGVVAALVITGLLATALAFSVQSWAQQHTTATHTALIFALEPVFAWLTSFVVARETLSKRAAFGAVLILAGILIVELKPVERKRHPSN